MQTMIQACSYVASNQTQLAFFQHPMPKHADATETFHGPFNHFSWLKEVFNGIFPGDLPCIQKDVEKKHGEASGKWSIEVGDIS